MAALKYVASAVLHRGAQKVLLHRHVDNNVDMSEQFIGYTWCKVRVSRDEGCVASRGGQGRGIIILLWGKVDQRVWYFHLQRSHMNLATVLRYCLREKNV